MENNHKFVLIELEALERKLAITKCGDQEESKEKGIINKRIQSLQHALAQTVAKIMNHVKKQLQSLMNSDKGMNSNLEDIQAFILVKKKVWASKRVWTDLECKEARHEINQLAKQLEDIHNSSPTRIDDTQQIIQFEETELYNSLLKCIKIQSPQPELQEEKYLITKSSLFDLSTGQEKKISFSKKCPRGCATFQINQKLYVAGGSHRNKEKIVNMNSFFSFNYSGIDTQLAKLPLARSNLSLCGVTDQLVSIGGYNGKPLNDSERYDIPHNRWYHMPSLNKPRQYAACCVSQKRTVFCFFGSQNLHSNRTSIQHFDLTRDKKWSLIDLPSDLSAILEAQLVAVRFAGYFMLFGNQNMYYLNDQGQLIGTDQDLKIPSGMRFGFSITKKDKMYAVGVNKSGANSKLSTYNGKRWKSIG